MNEHYIIFEQAKWLKEKDYEIETENVLFCIDEVNNIEEHQTKNRKIIYDGGISYKLKENEYRIYHQWEMIDWLLEKHGIWISVVLFHPLGESISFFFQIQKHKKNSIDSIDDLNMDVFHTPQEAYSVAFDYIIEKI